MCTRPALRAPPLRLPALRALPPLMLMMRPQPAVFMNGMQILVDDGFDRAGRGGRAPWMGAAPRAEPLQRSDCRIPHRARACAIESTSSSYLPLGKTVREMTPCARRSVERFSPLLIG